MARVPALRAIALAAYIGLLCASAPAWPDDWDGIGFVASVNDFDIARFRPHAPGYPVYVALLRIAAAAFGGGPMRACIAVAVLGGGVAMGLLWDAVRRIAGEPGAWRVAALVAATPMVWRACSGVGSESPALACAAVCAWGCVVSRRAPGVGATAIGLGAGLGLGVRLSWGPLYVAALALAPRAGRARAWAAAGAGCLVWAAPLVAVVGARPLAALYSAHLAGHAGRWGGSALTEHGPVRLAWLARDLFEDGLGAGIDALGLAVGGFLIAGLATSLGCARRAGPVASLAAGVAFVPYSLWVGLGQNLRDQPRHVLPLVVMFAAGIGLSAARSRAGSVVVTGLALSMSIRTALDARARRTIPPPGQQLLDLAREQPSPLRLAVAGGPSVRFFETTELALQARVAGSLGDVRMELTRLDELPARVWVTSEVLGLDQADWPLSRVATLCRPPRIDRRMPCLDVFSWQLPFLAR